MDTRGPPRVKNKAAAPVQISAEQLLREAVDRQEGSLQTPTQRFADLEELNEFRARKRREFEDYVRRNRVRLHNWLQYAQWELEQKEFARARSVFERALDVHPNNTQLWIRYIEAELKNRNVNHAKNLLDRAVTRLPRVNSLWFKYVYVQEILGDIEGTRQVFDRWMQWRPDEAAFAAYVKLEKKYGELDRAREVLRAWTFVHPEPRTWMKWAKFEQEYGTSETVRDVFQTAIQTIAETLGDDAVDERIFIAFAKFEARCKEYERARAIYNFALDALPRSKSRALHENYVKFQKQVGNKDDIEHVVITKRRRHYEEETRQNPRNYDAWIDFARLEESGGQAEKVREVYEQAISNLPPTQEKRHWRRFIFLWLFYAIWEESDGKNVSRAREVYKTMVGVIPNKSFTFAKAWVLWAQFELRHGELSAARKILGRALGICPKDKIFSEYIALETKLFEFTRCRKLYEKWLLYNPANSQTWTKWAQLELGLDDAERARAIFELAVNQPVLDMPEVVWKGYIDFEEEEGEYDRARALYERLLEKADHPKVWISYAIFEINIPEDEDEGMADGQERPVSDTAKARARSVFERAHKRLKEKELKAERVSVLKAWLEFEKTHGTDADVEKVQKQQARQTRKKRRLEDGTEEEYIDWIFPADDQQARNLSNLLAMANAWKQAGGSIASGGAA